jgi:hypothetical protein
MLPPALSMAVAICSALRCPAPLVSSVATIDARPVFPLGS